MFEKYLRPLFVVRPLRLCNDKSQPPPCRSTWNFLQMCSIMSRYGPNESEPNRNSGSCRSFFHCRYHSQVMVSNGGSPVHGTVRYAILPATTCTIPSAHSSKHCFPLFFQTAWKEKPVICGRAPTMTQPTCFNVWKSIDGIWRIYFSDFHKT